MTSECLDECDDLILWFSEGTYVYQAMELKMKYKPLTPLQQENTIIEMMVSAVRILPRENLPSENPKDVRHRIHESQTRSAKMYMSQTVLISRICQSQWPGHMLPNQKPSHSQNPDPKHFRYFHNHFRCFPFRCPESRCCRCKWCSCSWICFRRSTDDR